MNNHPPQTHQPGDISHTVSVSLQEAATGKTEYLIVIREDACRACSGTGQSWRNDDGTCSDCNNKGIIKYEKRFAVRLPAGVESDSKLRIAGEGNLEAGQAARGDLYVAVAVRPHELFERKGKDLHSFFRVTEDELRTGGEIIVPTLLDGQKRLSIPPGTNAGTTFRLAGLGLDSISGGERGDLFIKVGNQPVKQAVEDTRGPSAPAPPPRPSSTLRRGLVVTAGALALAGIIYFSNRPGGGNSSLTSNNTANATPTPRTGPRRRESATEMPTPIPTPIPLPRAPFSLANGTNITPPQGPRGGMMMIIINKAYQDMAVKVVSDSSQKTRRFVYVRAGSTVTIRNLPREVCRLRWETGEDWDAEGRRFLIGRSLQQFDSTFDLRKAHHRINFNPSEGGDLRETSLDESEFEDK